MKNLFNDIDSSEKDRILEMHKKKGYGTINEQNRAAGDFDLDRFARSGGRPTDPKSFKNPFTPQPQQNTNPNSKPLTPNQIKTQKVDEKGFEVKDVAITRNGKIIPKKGMGAQFCYAIPADKISAFANKTNITQTELTEAKQKGVSPWTDVQQFFRNNDLGQCKANDEAGLNDPMGKYVSIGTKSPFVKTIQLKLANAAEGYAHHFLMGQNYNEKKDPMDGNFGKTTAAIVKAYQVDNGISPADGRVRKSTWNSLKNVAVRYKYDVNTTKWEPIGGKVEKLQSIKPTVIPTDNSELTLKV